MSTFRDLFSGHAGEYARYRPTYPPELFAWLASQAPARDLAWDCGTGSGQAAVALAEHFARVVATDASREQLAKATPHDRVEYAQATAESPGLAGGSVDLGTVAQAFHWFDAPKFFAAAAAALKPGGVLALCTYRGSRVSPEIDVLELDLYGNILGPDWPGERRLVETGYSTVVIPPPFVELAAPKFMLTARWTRDDYVGYVGTWSSVHRHRARTGVDPLAPFERAITPLWAGNEVRDVRWDLSLRVMRRV